MSGSRWKAGTTDFLIERAAHLLAEVFEPGGVLKFWSSPINYLDGRRPCDLMGDVEALELVCRRLEMACDGNFS